MSDKQKSKKGTTARTSPVAKAGKRAHAAHRPPEPVMHLDKVQAAGRKVVVDCTMTEVEAGEFFRLNTPERVELARFVNFMEARGFTAHRTFVKRVR